MYALKLVMQGKNVIFSGVSSFFVKNEIRTLIHGGIL